MNKKYCNKCRLEKDITAFQFKTDRNKHDSVCKLCRNKKRRKKYNEGILSLSQEKEDKKVDCVENKLVVGSKILADEMIRVSAAFQILRRWRNEARRKNKINW